MEKAQKAPMNLSIKQTRFLVSVLGIFILAGITILSVFKGMEGVAATSTGGIISTVAGYHITQGFTKGRFISANSNKQNLEG